MKDCILGCLIGFLLFVIAIPFIMFLASPDFCFSILKLYLFSTLSGVGITLSIWSIVYMYFVGKGNPMDAFSCRFVSRTSLLMTKGPYKLCRNPMLFGILIYYIGILIFLSSYKSFIVFIVFALIMVLQVYFEQRRLEDDFGKDYIEYKKNTKILIPFIW